MAAESVVKQLISTNAVVIFSKTWCGYCSRVKGLFDSMKVGYKAVELNTQKDGEALQSYLGKLTGATSVPRVFVGGKFVGGCDDTFELHSRGELVKLLEAAGLTPKL